MPMLSSITLKNLATISDTSMEFEKGLNVITGETGSGKSILVDGLMLATGARADRTLIRPGARTASVEAVFQLPAGDETVIRREISIQGRSRVFIDEALSTLEEVREKVQNLVTLHSQRTTPVLLKTARQMDILDTFAETMPLREEYRQLFTAWKTASSRISELRSFLGESGASRELLLHEMSLFEKADPSLKDYELLVNKRQQISGIMEHSALFQETLGVLQGDDGVSALLSGVLRKLQREAVEKEELAELISQASISVEEASGLVLSEISDLEDAPLRISEIDARLDEYSVLISRCGGTIQSVMEYSESLFNRLQEYSTAEKELRAIEDTIQELSDKVMEIALQLTSKREQMAGKLAERAVAEMKHLNMPFAEFSVQFNPPPSPVVVAEKKLGLTGAESVLFMFSANKGIPRDSLESVASGGELSRVALALALVLAESASASTLIFDEIDAGTGGETAHNLAHSLLRAASSRQIIVISHLAQIASRADRHLAVTKTYSDEMPVTTVTALKSQPERLKELARLLGGGAGAEDHALSLLGAEF
ncbi:MAG: AAA family ATPase [Candidatus Sabulitectum sp.]|nr:AAA family ATPase [Candidatus Sabulitectum sp.]